MVLSFFFFYHSFFYLIKILINLGKTHQAGDEFKEQASDNGSKELSNPVDDAT